MFRFSSIKPASPATASIQAQVDGGKAPNSLPPNVSGGSRKPASWSQFTNRVGETCIAALATPARLLGCGPSRRDLFEIRVEQKLAEAGLEHLYVEGPRKSRANVKRGRFFDWTTGRVSKAEKYVWSAPFQGGSDGQVSLVGAGKQGYLAAKSFRSKEGREPNASALREARLLTQFGDSTARLILDDDGTAHLLMRLATGSLHDIERCIPAGRAVRTRQALARKTLRDMAEQLAKMHAAGYTHRDVKPGNLLCYEDGTLKLADFGRSRAFDETERSGTTGTLAFAPLEVLYCDEAIAAHSDVWSLGMTLLNTLVSLDEAPSRAGAARSSSAVMARVLDDLLELRAEILKAGTIDLTALDASQSSWAPYLRKVFAVDGDLTLHILESMVAPPQERLSARALADTASKGFALDDSEEIAMQKLWGLKSQEKDKCRAACIALDCAHEAFVRKRLY